MSKLNRTIRIAFSAALVAGFALPHAALAQDKGKGPDKGKQEGKKAGKVEKAKGKGEHVTTLQGVSVTREVFLANGYQVVNVVPSGTSQIIYYRRGNMGRGRGLGPVERIIVVPVGQVVQFRSVAPTLPQSVLATILSRLGM